LFSRLNVVQPIKSVYAANPDRHKCGADIFSRLRATFDVRSQHANGSDFPGRVATNFHVQWTRWNAFQWISLM